MDFNEALRCAKAKLWPQWRYQAKLGNEKMVAVPTLQVEVDFREFLALAES
jgi:hypothetical protein